MQRATRDSEGVAHVEFARERNIVTLSVEFEHGMVAFELEVLRAAIVVHAQTEARNGTVLNTEERRDVVVVPIGEKQAVARDEVDQAFEGGLDNGEIFEDVGVVEFQIIDDDGFWKVMDEFAAFVKEGGVIFVAFDDEPFAVSETGALP